jgi:hypothetical protein
VFVITFFINNHSMRVHMYLQCCDQKLLSAIETRFASIIIVLKRFFQVKEDLKVSDKKNNIHGANFVREQILDENEFWKKVEYILAFTESIYEMLRVVDTNKLCLHLVYEMCDNMIAKVKTIINAYEGKKQQTPSFF